jgi:hypothetical protein
MATGAPGPARRRTKPVLPARAPSRAGRASATPSSSGAWSAGARSAAARASIAFGLSDIGLSDIGLSDAGLCGFGLSESGLSQAGLSQAGLSEAGLSELLPLGALRAGKLLPEMLGRLGGGRRELPELTGVKTRMVSSAIGSTAELRPVTPKALPCRSLGRLLPARELRERRNSIIPPNVGNNPGEPPFAQVDQLRGVPGG